MKKLLLLIFVIAPALVFGAGKKDSAFNEFSVNSADTTVNYNNKKVIISEEEDILNIKVYDSQGENMKIISETQYGENSKTTKWEVASVDNLPFVSTFKKKKSNRKFSPNWAGVGFGFVNAFNDDVSIDFGASKEIFWNIFDVGVPLYDNCFGLVFGFGMDWRNYVLNGNKRFYRENHKVMIEDMPDYVDVKKSRIKTVDIVIPVMFEWQKYMKEYLYVQFGAQVNFRTHTSMKTLYYQSADGLPTPAKENMNGIGTNPMGLDLVVRAGYGFLGFYAKYSPTRMFQSDKGPQINSFSTGFIVTY